MSSTIKVALYSVDPPGLTTFDAFDPESFVVISAVNDALIYMDADGEVRPGLATSWHRVSPLEMELELRRGVMFQNGEPFDADSVVETFRAHLHPTPSAGNRGILNPILGATRVSEHTVRIQTAFPDAMLIRRLFLSCMYPARVLREQGRDALRHHPIGTGAYVLESYERGREVVLRRNPGHWSNEATIDEIRLPILRQKEWIDCLERGEIDVALNIDVQDRVRAGRLPGIEAVSRRAASTQWFLLSCRGPLADVRVRRALNHAIHRSLLVEVTGHGFGAPQRSVAAEGEHGFAECEPYRYSPELAISLLEAAGVRERIQLHGLVSETSTAVYFMVREFLARIGVDLHAEIVPRSEWLRRIAGGNMSGNPYAGDFALALVDNPILHSLFPQFIFLFGHGPYALHSDPDFDRQFLEAASTIEEPAATLAQQALERRAHDDALVLFTLHEHVHGAWRTGFWGTLPRTGNFDGTVLRNLRADASATPVRALPSQASGGHDLDVLLEAASHTGAFYLRPGTIFEEPAAARVWNHVQASETRWRLQNEPMLRVLVGQAEAGTNLLNVMRSTERVAIAGYSAEGRRLFVNRGYELMFGSDTTSMFERLGEQWPVMRGQVDAGGSWVGSVHLASSPAQVLPERLYLSITRALDEERASMGYTFVFSDFSGEEERIRQRAIRAVVGNVPYGLFLCDAQAAVLDGYSDACRRFFVNVAGGIEGTPLPTLLGLDRRQTSFFLGAYGQIFEDVLPDEVSLANLPERVTVGSRVYSLSGAVIRNPAGAVEAVLFTMLDLSALLQAERENEALRGLVEVQRHRARFEEFAVGLHARLEELALAGEANERAVRAELHMAKGVLGQFGLHDLAREIHGVEDQPTVSAHDARRVADSLRSLVQKNEALWGIRLGARASLPPPQSAWNELEARLAAATSLDDARRIAAECIERSRQMPVGELIGPLAESVRSHAHARGKKVRLVIEGAELAWPTRFARVFELVPQLVRNAIDHGLEEPDERGSKDETGTLRIIATSTNGVARVVVHDDGRGVDGAALGRRAIALGLRTEAEVAALGADERIRLLFVPGLSTAELSETSGRGVGMDAVESTVRALGGTVHVRSEPGIGTEIRLELPIS